jgi:dienelactone hydrolase
MPTVLARAVYSVAAVVLAASLLGIHRGAGSVTHYPVTLPGGIPAVVYEPGPPRDLFQPPPPGQRYPVVVLAHGFSASKGGMDVLARRLARAGYAVITFDFRGHGFNPAPFGWGLKGLYEDLANVVLYASSQARFDFERLVVAGHSMGGGAVLGYAARSPGAAAVVGISGGVTPDGPYPLPSTLLIWASSDPQRIRENLRSIGARLADLERLVLERTYGDPERGNAVRLSEVDGNDHLTILYSEEAARRILSWLRETVRPPPDAAMGSASDGRLAWAGLGLVAALVLLFGAARALAPAPGSGARAHPVDARRGLLQLIGAHLVALVLLGAVDPRMGGGLIGLIPLVAGADLVAFYLVSGVCLFGLILVRGDHGPRLAPNGRELVAAAVLTLVVYVVLVATLSPFWDLRLAAHRIPWAAGVTALCVPFFLATEWSLRGDARTRRWLSPIGKALTFLFIVGGAVSGLLPFILLLALGPLVFLFAMFEFVAIRIGRVNPEPWVPALVQAVWTGWIVAALFPVAV